MVQPSQGICVIGFSWQSAAVTQERNGRVADFGHRISFRLADLGPSRLADFGTSSQPPTFVDYCCGMGGASLGALQAGYRILGAVDSWPVACSSYGLNLPAQVRCADLARDTVSWDEDVDCMWASKAGSRLLNEERCLYCSMKSNRTRMRA